MTPKWLLLEVVKAVHLAQLEEHGGSPGIRDEGALLSALARSENLFSYGEPSIFELATAYASGIVRNHPFVDGNKRTGFLAAFIFLKVNGCTLQAPEPEAVLMTLGLASREIEEADYTTWLEANCVKQREEGK
ncbi:MAG: type II toxin-antitoxin system death-on-curing family toxin [Trueperaceae bacterium]